MSMQLEFEPDGWYYGFALRCTPQMAFGAIRNQWRAYIDDGNSYRIVELESDTLKGIKDEIVNYHLRDEGKHAPARYMWALRSHKFKEVKNA